MGKGGGTQNVTQTTKVELPAWVTAASKSNYRLAEQIANKPLAQYSGTGVADMAPEMQQAFDLFKSSMGTGSGALTNANDLLAKAGGGIAGMDRSAYMNPYSAEVEQAGLGALNDQRIQALMGNADKASAAKAFGGSRSAIVDAITNAESAKAAGQLSAGIHADAFNQATGAMQSDIGNMLGAAGGFQSQASAEQAKRNANFSGLLGIGSQKTAQDQKLIDSDKAKFDEANGYDLERLNILLSSLGMSPYGKTETSTKTVPTQGTDWASAGAGILSMLGGIFSDRTEKTDIKKLGKDKMTGLDLYAYRYKGDPKNYPKVVGPMAQDVEKMFPGLTKVVGGKLVVNVNV